jgi:hypothetical protein
MVAAEMVNLRIHPRGLPAGQGRSPLNSKGHCAARTNRANILLMVKVVMGRVSSGVSRSVRATPPGTKRTSGLPRAKPGSAAIAPERLGDALSSWGRQHPFPISPPKLAALIRAAVVPPAARATKNTSWPPAAKRAAPPTAPPPLPRYAYPDFPAVPDCNCGATCKTAGVVRFWGKADILLQCKCP